MPGRSLRVVTGLLAALLVGCAPSPAPSVVITQPPVPTGFVPWPDIVWTTVDLPARPAGAGNERVGAIAAGERGFAAVGYRETVERDGVVWSSADGLRWTAIADPAFKGIELTDVAAAPGGFVMVGVSSPDGEHPTTVVFRSDDGKAWHRLPPLPTTGDIYPPVTITGGAAGVLVVGSDALGGVTAWRSTDGRAFERATLTGPAGDGLIDPHSIDGGFIALGTKDGAPAMLRSADATSWEPTTIDARTDADASNVVQGRWGIVAQGVVSPDCDVTAESCVPTDIAWWSLDGMRWTVLPGADSPVVDGVSLLVAAGDHGLLAIDGADAWYSPDGWAWRALPEPGDGSIDIDDALVRGDMIVAVGTQPSDVADTSDGRILVGRPPLASPS